MRSDDRDNLRARDPGGHKRGSGARQPQPEHSFSLDTASSILRYPLPTTAPIHHITQQTGRYLPSRRYFLKHLPRRGAHPPERRLEMTTDKNSTAKPQHESSPPPSQPPPAPSPSSHAAPSSPLLQTPSSLSPMAAVAPWAFDSADFAALAAYAAISAGGDAYADIYAWQAARVWRDGPLEEGSRILMPLMSLDETIRSQRTMVFFPRRRRALFQRWLRRRAASRVRKSVR